MEPYLVLLINGLLAFALERVYTPGMNRFFNTTGPCVSAEHYMLPASVRCAEVFNLIERRQYFVIHAARQSGKTTLLAALASELNAGTTYRALYCSLESVQEFNEPERGYSGRDGDATLIPRGRPPARSL